ncbi:sensor histidine kinase [Paenibacillus sp. IHBB 10380]|uniref:sensor histidine kinase n=1 Tax=Paenibacillus sp. IHBB 10380 TaxID=1566358 RepID=UPI0005CFC28B|nr:sensor histidine kinase [Paenibacillus sp. IHBB 10380]AJS60445.1 hypothetical protein UB51_20545 [Paenibacillus sp. IHBB 10380]
MDNIFLEELFYLVTLPFLSVIIHYFFSHCFVCRVEKKLNLVLLYFLYFACSIALHFSPLPGTVLLTLNIGLIVLLSFLYRGNLKWRVCAALFIVALIILSDVAMSTAYSTKGYIINLFLSKLLMLILVLISVRIAKTYGNGSLSGWYWFFLFFCPLISIMGVTHLSSNLFFRTYPDLFPIICVGLLIINFLIFVLSDRVLCVQSAQNKSQLLEQQNAYYVNQYLLTKEMQEESFRLQHDFKNILLGLRAKLHSGEEETTKNELNKLLGKIENPAGVCHSGNIIIDSIINYKQQVAEKYTILFYLDLNIPPRLELDTTVISVILGNALDNAIEACKEKTNVERYIKIHMHYLNDSLFLRIQNPFVNKIHTNLYGEIRSTKSDKQSHGLGLKNIKKIVDECDGLLDISYSNSLFQIEIVLFKIQSQKSVLDPLAQQTVTIASN